MAEHEITTWALCAAASLIGLVIYRSRGRLLLLTFCKASFGVLMRDVAVEHFAHGKSLDRIAKEKGLALPVVKSAVEVFAWAKRAEADIENACLAREASEEPTKGSKRSDGSTGTGRRRGRRRSA